MNQLLVYASTLAVFAVLIVLCLGLWTMMRGKSANLSQTFMRWRVGLQFAAVIVIMVTLYFKG